MILWGLICNDLFVYRVMGLNLPLVLLSDECRQELDLNRAQWTVNDYWGSVGRDVGVFNSELYFGDLVS